MIETHAHLDFPQFANDLDAVLNRAREAGVKKLITIGIDLEASRRAIALSEKYPQVYASVGLHPHAADTCSKTLLQQLEILCQHPKVVAIGETGLDFYRNLSESKNQQHAFEAQIQLAIQWQLPLIIHIRNAFQPAFQILLKLVQDKIPVVLHCFQEEIDAARQAIDAGFFLSFNGTLTYKNSRLPKVVAAIPLNRILLETDCPFLTPAPYRGQRNEPAYLTLVLEKLASLFLQQSKEQINQQLDSNAQTIFGFSKMN